MTSSRVHDAERLLRKGDLPRAIAAMEAAVKKNPDDVKGRRQLADTYAKAGRFEDAVRELVHVADAFAREGLLLKATSAYKAVLDIDPDHEATRAALAELQQESRGGALAEAAGAPESPPPLPDDHDVLSAEDIVDEVIEAEADDVIDADALLEPEEAAGAEGGVDEADHVDGSGDVDDTVDLISLEAEEADDLIVAEADEGEDDEEIDRSILPELPLFADLPVHAFDELVSDLDAWRVPAGATIVRQGELGHSCFVVVSGEVRVERDGAVLATLERGDLFGEMALLSDSPRAASVVAASACELFEIKRERLENLMGRYPSVERVLQRFCRERLLANVLRASLFEGLDERLVREMIRAFRTRKVRMGERVVTQGEKGKGLCVVLAGELDVSRREGEQVRTVSQLTQGDVFGEMSLLLDEPASATVMALSNSTLLVVSRRGFEAFVQRHPVMKRRLAALAEERRASHAAAG